MSGMKVMARDCDTCVFSKASPVRAGRMAQLRAQWRARDTHQVCHHSAVWDEDDPEDGPPDETVVCHGFFEHEFMERGTGQMLRISERLGGFEFVEPPTIAQLRERSG